MMLPDYPTSVPAKPAANSEPVPLAPTPVVFDDNRPQHADYNLQPLTVHSLGHYVFHGVDDERFHVS